MNLSRMFINLRQKSNSVADYLLEFVSVRSALEAAHIAARNNPDEKMPDDHQQAVMFICGLNRGYSSYIRLFEREIKSWPETLNQAYIQASKEIPETVGNLVLTTIKHDKGKNYRGNGGDHNKYSKTDLKYGSRDTNCNTCGQKGHWARECRAKKEESSDDADIKKAVKDFRETSKTPGGGSSAWMKTEGHGSTKK
jgi:hypothetical protein